MQEILDDDFLENVGYFFDVNVCEFPYPEIQQLRALEAFRRSQVRMPALKENILNLRSCFHREKVIKREHEKRLFRASELPD